MRLILSGEVFEVDASLASECGTLSRVREGADDADDADLAVPLDSNVVQRQWLRVWLGLDEVPDMDAVEALEVVKVRVQVRCDVVTCSVQSCVMIDCASCIWLVLVCVIATRCFVSVVFGHGCSQGSL